ncbi:FecR family protein [uncultured Polaribacter sp.]|uniref:FecR family protein n=1 Tax=uncultured Polaribacter sp. TaxID=174711 RepID=UPI002633485A|nr:FecR family protein [uncultured Polaribacter sp.]
MEINRLIEKFLKNECSKEEISILNDFFKKKKITAFDKDFLIAWKSENEDVSLKFKEEAIWSQLKEKTAGDKNQNLHKRTKKRNSHAILKYAAVFVGIITTAFYVFNNSSSTEEQKSEQPIKIKLADGSTKKIQLKMNLDTLKSRYQKLAVQKGNKLIYFRKEKDNNSHNLEYNTLTVPYGKKFQVILSDGSQIYLNSGSSLKYPVAFIEGQKREVFLNGEGYFKIAKNKKDAFIVHAKNIRTKVYGTEFNIASYDNEENINIVLVEGSVGVFKALEKNKENKLKPNQIATYSKSDKKMKIANVAIDSHIAWIDNVLLFKNEKFSIILKKLERHYGVKITINNENFYKDERFTGRFEVESIEDVLKTMNKVLDFQFTKNNNQISIHP